MRIITKKITRTIKPRGVHFRVLEQRYMEEQNTMAQHPKWLLSNITYCYEREYAPNNVGKNNTSCSIKSNIIMAKKFIQVGQRI